MKLAKIISRHPTMTLIDGKLWSIDKPMRWSYIDKDGDEVLAKVPCGFVTDLASIPCFIPMPEGPYNVAGVIHDQLYQEQVGGCTRLEADRVLRDGCKMLGVSAFQTWIIYRGVRIGGWVVWNRYRRLDQKKQSLRLRAL